MTTGYVLVLAVLVLGGVIATLGDRIGMRVGKARLSLFRLRPRQTATVVSILTGSVISASTLALLFGVSRQLRTGVFELEQIQADLAQARADLNDARQAKTDIEDALGKARGQQRQAQDELKQTQTQLTMLRSQLGTVSDQAEQLRSEIERLEAERTELKAERDREIADRDAQINQREQRLSQLQRERDLQIARRDAQIAQREQRLSQLQAQQALLQDDIATLERQYEGLFRGSVVVGRNQPLAVRLIQVNSRQEARQAVERLLQQANRTAIREIAPGTSPERQVLQIPQADIAQLINRISDRQEYVVRILSAANYIIGEPCVVAEGDPCIQIFINVLVNDIIYAQNEHLATVSVNPRNLTDQALVDKLNLLIASLQFRARQDGIVGDTLQIADGRVDALRAFLDIVKQARQPVDIRAIAAAPTYTLGPLRVELLAVRNGTILARTDELPANVVPDDQVQETDPER